MQLLTRLLTWDGSHIPGYGMERFLRRLGQNDPAWCLWDLLTDTRYGAGVPEASLDRYDFFAISQYCKRAG